MKGVLLGGERRRRREKENSFLLFSPLLGRRETLSLNGEPGELTFKHIPGAAVAVKSQHEAACGFTTGRVGRGEQFYLSAHPILKQQQQERQQRQRQGQQQQRQQVAACATLQRFRSWSTEASKWFTQNAFGRQNVAGSAAAAAYDE